MPADPTRVIVSDSLVRHPRLSTLLVLWLVFGLPPALILFVITLWLAGPTCMIGCVTDMEGAVALAVGSMPVLGVCFVIPLIATRNYLRAIKVTSHQQGVQQ